MSKLTVVNQALGLIGEPAIFALTENSSSARLIEQHYEPCLAHLLASHAFRFSLEVATLQLDATATPFPRFTTVFHRPQSALRIIELTDGYGNTIEYKESKGHLHTAVDSPITVTYTVQVPIEDTSPLFRTAFACYLATQLVVHTTDTLGRSQLMQQQFHDHWMKCVNDDGWTTDIQVLSDLTPIRNY